MPNRVQAVKVTIWRIGHERYHVARKVPFNMQFYMEGTILLARWYLSRPTRYMVPSTADTLYGTFHSLHAICHDILLRGCYT